MKGTLRIRLIIILSFLPFYIQSQLSPQEKRTNILNSSCKKGYNLFNKQALTPDDYDIIYHHLKIKADPFISYLSASVYTTFEILSPTSEVVFDCSSQLKVDSIFDSNQQKLPYLQESNQLKIFYPTQLNAGNEEEVTIYYQGNPYRENSRSFETIMRGESPAMWTLSQPYGSKDWWPCKERLNDKIDSITISITTPERFTGVANGILISQENKDGWDTYTWHHRFPIPAYLVAFAISDYTLLSFDVPISNGTVKVDNYLFDDQAEFFTNAVNSTSIFMQLFDTLLTPYPYIEEKYGHAMMGENRGGMEHTTISFMSTFTFDLISHELAHQWFGDFITCGTWKDIWLNESFATYMTGLSYEWIDGEENFLFWKEVIGNSIMRESDGSVAIQDTTDVGRMFSSRLTYRKGAYFLHMLRYVMGDEAFYTSIRNYLNDPNLSFGFASTAIFIEHLNATSNPEIIEELFNDWFYGEGHPEYSILWNQNQQNLVVEIQQKTSHSSVDFFEMPLELLLTFDDNSTEMIQVQHEFNGQYFNIALEKTVSNIEFNPNLNILTPEAFIANRNQLDQLQVYPNPARSEVKIEMLHPEALLTTLLLYDSQGRIVKEIDVNYRSRAYNLDVSTLPMGVYHLHAQSNRGYNIKKLVVYH